MNIEKFILIRDGIVPDENGCRIWPKAKTERGYPKLRIDNLWRKGHRVSLELKLGRAIAPGMVARHTCDNPSCVEETHLLEGTQSDNMQDALARGRFAIGDRHGSRLHPDRLPRGDQHFSRTMPDRIPRGERHGSRTKPENLPRGERNGSAKLREDQVLEIARIGLSGTHSVAAIARMFGVGTFAIRGVITGRTWSHVTGMERPSSAKGSTYER